MTRWLATAALVGACGASVGCGGKSAEGAPAAGPPSPAATAAPKDPVRIERGDVRQLDARERPPMDKRPLAAGDLTGEVESASPPVVAAEGQSTKINVPIGAATDVECFVYSHAIDPGGQLLALMKALPKTIDVKLVRPTDAVVVGEYGAVFVEAEYLVKTAAGTVLGDLKAVVYAHPITPMLCLHDEVGYRQTFKRVALGLAQSLKLAGKALRPSRFVEITVDRFDGHPTGFSRSVLFDNDDGSRVMESTSVDFDPRSPTELTAEDSAQSEVWDKDGHIRTLTYVKAEGGEVSEKIVAKRFGAQEYAYEGLHLGKKVAGKFKTKGPHGLTTDAVTAAALKKLLGGAHAADLREEVYHPDLDPTATVEVVYRPLAGGGRKVSMAVGKVQGTATIDADGRPEKLELPVGSAAFSAERAFLRGSL